MATLNLGILAHVDAGKTSLTERILFETGVIAGVGRVDHGTTQTDTLSLERQRGITIQSAVASFTLGELTVNLIDTPGHPDFIAEVDRALQVLDAVILVVSAVEGVQPQTHRLAQAVTSAGIPLVIFINKIDRLGARGMELLPEIGRALGLAPVAMTSPAGVGTREATVCPFAHDDPALANALIDRLAEVDDSIVARFLDLDGDLPAQEMHAALVRLLAAGAIAPVFFGSAMTGAGVADLLAELPRLLPGPAARPEEPLSAIVFKVQRSPAGEKLALARLFAGTLAVRDHVVIRRALANGSWAEHEARVTGVDHFMGSLPVATGAIAAGAIARVHGLREVLTGDVLGDIPTEHVKARFPTPTLESIIRPLAATDAARLYAALQLLEEQDPLISIRRGQREPTLSVRLYGEVQKEVIQATLHDEFNLPVAFDQSQTICIERVTGTGAAHEVIGDADNPFLATVGLRIEPHAPGAGIVYRRDLGALPLAFYRAIEETIHTTLEEGLLGWPVRDGLITLTEVGMWPPTAAGDFRKLTPLVLMAALQAAGTEVCEPIARFTLELPSAVLGETYTKLTAASAVPEETSELGERSRITGTMPAAAADRFERLVPGLTSGNGFFHAEAAGHQPIRGTPPRRARTDFDPLQRKRYLAAVNQA